MKNDQCSYTSEHRDFRRRVMTKPALNTTDLSLTIQERKALSVALKATLRFWGNSECAAQERIRAKLQAVVVRLDKLAQEREARMSLGK
jgi:hypothetical protein